ncbi:hypothetical protein MAR_037567 [Mya arenaria]|uniref:VWFA domain-containing protein n=1 Tax=Mya arenaria TaxID=6604 RepID=A0ABY7FNU2_MYAAR|nr:hypothetical protein MAR_037567 [Mya arenaria]
MDNTTLLQAIEDSMGTVTCEGPTMVNKALDFVASEVFVEVNGARNGVGRYVIVLTDGLFSNPLKSRESAHILHSQTNAYIYAIAAGSVVKPQGLLDISSSYRNVYPIGMHDSIQNVLKQTMFGCEGCSRKGSDITMLFDVSSETHFEDFDALLRAGEFIIKNTELSKNNSDISMATYGEDYVSLVRFRENNLEEKLMQVLNTAVRQTAGTRRFNMSSLVKESMKELPDSNGRRNVIIFLTNALNLNVDSDTIE